MPTFFYKAINEGGIAVSGNIEADSLAAASAAISAKGLIPIKTTLSSQSRPQSLLESLSAQIHRVSADDLVMFTTQFRTMIRAGVPMMTIFQALETQTEDVYLTRIIISMRQDVTEGKSLYEAFSKHPKVFPPLYCSMLRAGEASGALAEVLDRLIHIMQHENKIRGDIRAALQYPAIVVLFLVVAFFVLLTYVIPKFSDIFLKANITLPLPTKICVAMYNGMVHYWPGIIIGLSAVVVGLVSYFRTDKGRLAKDRLLLSLPLFGPLFIKSAMARFSSIFAILQTSGVAVLDAIKILSDTVNNKAIANELEIIGERLEEGRGYCRTATPIPVFYAYCD